MLSTLLGKIIIGAIVTTVVGCAYKNRHKIVRFFEVTWFRIKDWLHAHHFRKCVITNIEKTAGHVTIDMLADDEEEVTIEALDIADDIHHGTIIYS